MKSVSRDGFGNLRLRSLRSRGNEHFCYVLAARRSIIDGTLANFTFKLLGNLSARVYLKDAVFLLNKQTNKQTNEVINKMKHLDRLLGFFQEGFQL